MSSVDIHADPSNLELRRASAARDPTRAELVELELALAGPLSPEQRRAKIEARETAIARNACTWMPEVCELVHARVRGSYAVTEAELEFGYLTHVRAWADRLGPDKLDVLAASGCTSLALALVEPAHLAQLRHSPLLGRLRRLELDVFSGLDPVHVLELLRAPELGPLEHLGLGNVALTPEIAACITKLPSLRSLRLGSPSLALDAEFVTRLADAPALAQLRSLVLAGASLDAKALARLLDAAFVPRLERLGLCGLKLGARGCGLLAKAELDNLVELGLAESTLGKHAAAFLSSPRLARVERLDLDATKLGAKNLPAILASLDLPGLRCLRLGGLRMKEAGAAALAESDALARCNVVELSLAANALGDDGAEALAEAEGLAGIRRLRLDHNGIRADGLAALRDSPLLRGLEVLDISNNKIQTKGAALLAKTLAAPTLRELDIDHNWIGNKGATALLGGDALAALEHVRFGYENNFDDAGLDALTHSSIRLRTLISGNLGSGPALARYLESTASERLGCVQAYVSVAPNVAHALAEGTLAPSLHTLYIEPSNLDAPLRAALDRRFALSITRGNRRTLEFWRGV